MERLSSAVVDGDVIEFVRDDPEAELRSVTLQCDRLVAGDRHFTREGDAWTLRLPCPDQLRRLEYRLALTDNDGVTTVECDPGNPERVRTRHGERSVVLLPGYERPGWLLETTPIGMYELLVPDVPGFGEVPIRLWSPNRVRRRDQVPLLVVHDGAAYADLAELPHYAAAMISRRELPPFRLALFDPRDREGWYTANDDYVVAELAALEAIDSHIGTRDPLVVMGAGIGGLCALLVGLRSPRFAGVFAQSGLFQPAARVASGDAAVGSGSADTDPPRSGRVHLERMAAAARAIREPASTPRPLTIGLTCNLLERRLGDNREIADRLRSQGHRVALTEVRDVPGFAGWRDSLQPALTDVLRTCWGAQG